MDTNDRIRLLRKDELHLSQAAFGEKLGVSRDVINNIENNRLVNPQQKEPIIKLICRTFNVDYFWLTEGVGEMFTHYEEVIVEQIVEQYDLDNTEKAIVLAYLEADKETRKVIENFILDLAEKIKNKDEE